MYELSAKNDRLNLLQRQLIHGGNIGNCHEHITHDLRKCILPVLLREGFRKFQIFTKLSHRLCIICLPSIILSCFLQNLGCPGQGGEFGRNFPKRRVDPALALFLLFLDFLPVLQHLLRGVRLYRAKHMGMAAHHLLRNLIHHILHGEQPFLPGDLRMHNNLQKHIPKLLLQVFRIARFIVDTDGGKHLRCLLRHARAQTLMGLFPVPRAAVLSTQRLYNLKKILVSIVISQFHLPCPFSCPLPYISMLPALQRNR